MVHITTRGLAGFICLCLPIFGRAVASTPKDTELICSKTDPKDCYPRLFEPTKDFQQIREGQDIPPGLHVRLNIYTGEREARLNIPMEGEEQEEAEKALEGLPTEQSVVVVEQPEAEAEAEIKEEVKKEPSSQIPKDAPAYEKAGKITTPPPGTDDMTTFQKAIISVQMESRFFDTSLDELLELSHDIYYGVEIIKDGPVLERLICFTLGLGTERYPATEKERDHKAASILSSALQNNPTALEELSTSSHLVTNPSCGTTHTPNPGKSDFISHLRSRLGKERAPHTLKAKVSTLSTLLRSPIIRTNFLQKGAMELLLAIFLKKGQQWDMVKEKVGQLVTDNFLDADSGADLGVWPTAAKEGGEECEVKGKMLDDACWEWHVGKFAGDSGKEWASELVEALRVQRRRRGGEAYDRGL